MLLSKKGDGYLDVGIKNALNISKNTDSLNKSSFTISSRISPFLLISDY
ncbi:hypothetical protein PAMA111031_01015 [Paraphotobacterium marinum]